MFFKVPLKDTQASISQVVAMSVLRQIADFTQMGDIAVSNMYLTAYNDHVNPTGAAIDSDRFKITTDTTAKVLCTFSEDYNEHSYLTTKSYYGNSAPKLFYDPALPIISKPIYSHTTVKLSITYRTTDLQEAVRWRNGLRLRVAEGIQGFPHEVTYSYVYPDSLFAVIYQAWKLRETQAKYNQPFKDYFRAHTAKDHFRIATNLAGGNPTLVVKEQQTNVQGFWDFDIPPKEEKEDTIGVFKVTVDYTFSYEKPIECSIKYPLLVHNLQMPAEFAVGHSDWFYHQLHAKRSDNTKLFDVLRKLNFPHEPGTFRGDIRIPYIDDWCCYKEPRTFHPVLTALTMLNPDDKQTLASLSDVHYATLNTTVAEYLYNNRAKLTMPYASLFYVTVYEDTTMVPAEHIEIVDLNALSDPRINLTVKIKSTYPTDLRKTYHVRMSLLTSLVLLDDDAKRDLINYPDIIDLIVDELSPNPTPVKRPVTLPDVIDIINKLPNKPDWYKTYRDKSAYLCGTAYIITHPERL